MIEGRGYDSNIYVFEDVVVDTGTGENIGYFFDSLKNAGIDMDDLSLIVNTHNHYDHVGGNRYLDLEVAMHLQDAIPFEGGDEVATAACMFGRSMGKMTVDLKLQEGDKIGKFEVLHTPGHTRGCICLYDGGTLISGDTVFAGGGFGRVDLGGNLDDMIASLERLSKLEVENLLPGHGPWSDHGSENIRWARDILNTL
jgi:glyoxylase-like metal-dependent hydrolase (beta-lactamase superfamily II)